MKLPSGQRDIGKSRVNGPPTCGGQGTAARGFGRSDRLARIGNEQLVGRSQVGLLQVDTPHVCLELEFVQGAGLLLGSALIVEQINADVAIDTDGFGLAGAEEQQLTAEAAR